MASSRDQEINHRLREARSLPDDSLKLILYEEAIQYFDVQHNIQRAFDLRMEYVELAMKLKEIRKMLVAFAWCLAQWDRNAELGNPRFMYVEYQRILFDLIETDQLEERQMIGLLNDYGERIRKDGYSPRSGSRLKLQYFKHLKLKKLIQLYYCQWEQDSIDVLSLTTEGCEAVLEKVWKDLNTPYFTPYPSFWLLISHWKKLKKQSDNDFWKGNHCAVLLHPLVYFGFFEIARVLHEEGYALIKNDPTSLYLIDEHLIYLMLLKQYDRAWQIFETHLPWACETSIEQWRSDYFRLGYSLLTLMDESDPRREETENAVTMNLPDRITAEIQPNPVTRNSVAYWFFEQYTAIENNLPSACIHVKRDASETLRILLRTRSYGHLQGTWRMLICFIFDSMDECIFMVKSFIIVNIFLIVAILAIYKLLLPAMGIQ